MEIYCKDIPGENGIDIQLIALPNDKKRPAHYEEGGWVYDYLGDVLQGETFYTVRYQNGLLDFDEDDRGYVTPYICDDPNNLMLYCEDILDRGQGPMIEEWTVRRKNPLESKIVVEYVNDNKAAAD